MPEGDALHLAARRLQVLVGQSLEVETPHPRAAVKQLAPLLDGRRLESVEAVGKNLLLRFDGGLVLRSHLRMKGRWRVLPRDAPLFGTPWLVLRGDTYAGALWHGPVLELDRGVARRLGPDILAEPPDLERMLANVRPSGRSGRSAMLCSTRASLPVSATSGKPRRCGRRKSRRGGRSRRCPTTSSGQRSRPRTG
jgi:endonuclease VIII